MADDRCDFLLFVVGVNTALNAEHDDNRPEQFREETTHTEMLRRKNGEKPAKNPVKYLARSPQAGRCPLALHSTPVNK